jgi:hypothetical protein
MMVGLMLVLAAGVVAWVLAPLRASARDDPEEARQR